jgi:hypothetical protein
VTAISDFSSQVVKEVVGCPSFEADSAVAATLIEFAKKTEIFRRSFDHAAYDSGVNLYENDEIRIDISSMDAHKRPHALHSLAVDADVYLRHDGNLVHLVPAGNIANRDAILHSGRKYYYFPSRTEVAVFPVETSEIASAPTYINLEVVLVPLGTITEIDDEVYDDHLETILAGAKMRLFRQPGKAWTDMNLSGYWQGIYQHELAGAIGSIFNSAIHPTIQRKGYI